MGGVAAVTGLFAVGAGDVAADGVAAGGGLFAEGGASVAGAVAAGAFSGWEGFTSTAGAEPAAPTFMNGMTILADK